MTDTDNRKDDHIRINLEKDVKSGLSTGFNHFTFTHQALPEIDFQEVNVGCQFLGKQLSAPIMISSMTGGTQNGNEINLNLARAAQKAGIAMGVGSQRNQIESGYRSAAEGLRNVAPDIPLFANLGAIQLNYGFGPIECQTAIDMLGADGLILHLNPLQEVLQAEGQTNFKGLLKKIEQICLKVNRPVIVKEVGWGISPGIAQELVDCGVSVIDVAGAGGTSWSEVEMHRNSDDTIFRIASRFKDWGIPTSQAIKAIHLAHPEIQLIASGGLRTGMDLAKAIALGASLGGFAGHLLKVASESTEQVEELLREITLELKIVMFAAGAADIQALRNTAMTEKKDEYSG